MTINLQKVQRQSSRVQRSEGHWLTVRVSCELFRPLTSPTVIVPEIGL